MIQIDCPICTHKFSIEEHTSNVFNCPNCGQRLNYSSRRAYVAAVQPSAEEMKKQGTLFEDNTEEGFTQGGA